VELAMVKLVIKQVRSDIDRKEDQKRTLIALGITRSGLVVVHNDTPQIRGMINKVKHLLEVKEVEE
jgi:large subunit ribosomal protein L30